MKEKASWMAVAALAVLVAASGTARAQAGAALPVPGYEPAREVPGGKELPDPSLEYKVLFDILQMAPNAGEVNPGLIGVARYLNTLAKYGVPAERRKIAVVLHGPATEIIVNNATFKERNNRQDNVNIPLIQSLKRAGVQFHVCGQAVLGRKIDPATIQPEIQLDLWALTTIVNLQSRGYVRVGGN